MVGSNILTRKQLQKMTNEQLIDFDMKLQDNRISTQTESINDNKQFREKLNVIEAKFDDLKKENETFQSKVTIAEKTSTILSINHKKLNDGIIEMENARIANASKLQEFRAVSQTTFSKITSF